MATPRCRLVDLAVARWYHCITRCVRRAFLINDGSSDRRAWIERRLEELGQIFAIAVGGFSILDNHLHTLLRVDPETASGWTDEEVVRRWGRLFPPRNPRREIVPVSDQSVRERLSDRDWVAESRRRLFREGKAAISAELAGILERIGCRSGL